MAESVVTPIRQPVLSTSRLALRCFTPADTEEVFALRSSKSVSRYWDAPPWRERAQAEQFVARSAAMAQEATGVRLAVDRRADGRFIGWCAVFGRNHEFRRATLGYCFTEEAWGHGFATEAAGALLAWAFPTMDLNRVHAEADTRNIASVRVLEKLGFRREGMMREDTIVEGEVSDSFIFGLLRREWRAPTTIT